MADSQKQSSWAWARDVLLTVFLPPIGLLFTGPELFRASKRSKFTRAETALIAFLFALGILLTLRIVLMLMTDRSSYDTTVLVPSL